MTDAHGFTDESFPAAAGYFHLGAEADKPQGDWRLIETYPDNGRQVLLWYPELSMPGVHYIETIAIGYRWRGPERHFIGGAGRTWPVGPLYWQPLPPMPR